MSPQAETVLAFGLFAFLWFLMAAFSRCASSAAKGAKGAGWLRYAPHLAVAALPLGAFALYEVVGPERARQVLPFATFGLVSVAITAQARKRGLSPREFLHREDRNARERSQWTRLLPVAIPLVVVLVAFFLQRTFAP